MVACVAKVLRRMVNTLLQIFVASNADELVAFRNELDDVAELGPAKRDR